MINNRNEQYNMNNEGISNLIDEVDFFDSVFYQYRCKVLFILRNEGKFKGEGEIELNIHQDYIDDKKFVSNQVFKVLLENQKAEIGDVLICKVKNKQRIH